MAGIRHPSLIACGFLTHARNFSGVFGAAPEPSVSRLIKCVRSGPNVPLADVPWTAWQLTHDVEKKRSRPADPCGSSAAGLRWDATQLANSSGGCAMTRRRIFACCVPQYSAQLPRYAPACLGSIHILLTRLGIKSVFPAS